MGLGETSSVLDILSLPCWEAIQVEVSKRQLEMRVWNSKKRSWLQSRLGGIFTGDS